MDLQPPSVLAQLPRPLHASTGKTHISEVYSLANAKKRKRYEVAVAVDGEAVNLYNIQNPKLVTSYAVPPQSLFSCPPCSLRRKLSKNSGVKRQTFVALKKEIKAFTEESAASGTGAPVISSSTFAIEDSTSPAVFVGIVPGSEDEENGPFDVLVIHRDGRVRRLSPDLEAQRWSMQHSEISKGDFEVHGSFLLEFDDAKKSLFKRRPDLASLAAGDSVLTGGNEPSILLLVSYPVGTDAISLSEVKVQIFSIPAEASSRSLDESQQMRHLLSANLPDLDGEKVNRGNLHWQFHSGSAGLNLSFEKGFVNFDLSQYTPAATSKFILEGENFSSVMRVSAQSVIGAGKSMIALYDTQYKSIQRSIVAEDLPSAASNKARTTFLNYFAKLDLVVATKGNSLLAFDLASSQTVSGSSGKRSRDGLLIDAIGRGIGSASQWEEVSKKHRSNGAAALGLTSSEEIDKWNKLSRELRECAKNKDANGFDRAVLAYFSVGDTPALPEPGQYVNLEVVLFVLSLIFSAGVDTTSTDKLSAFSSVNVNVAIWPTLTCEWLNRLGYLYPGNVEAALRRAYKPRILPQLPIGTFAQALQTSDPSLGRLINVLQGPASFNPDELAHALKIFLNLARTISIPAEDQESQSPKALTNGETTDNTTNALTTSDSADSTPSTLQTTFTGLNTTLLSLHAHPTPSITSSLRSTLSRTDLISTIHHLRLSLATGGHATRFTETPPTPISPHLTSPSLPLNTIIDLMNAAVDAIGPSGWVSIAPGDLNLGTSEAELSGLRDMALIAEMKSEVSAALAGVEEATLLSGMLREYLRYCKSVTGDERSRKHAKAKKDDASSAAPSSTSVRHEKLNGADLLVFGAQDEDGEGGDGDASGKLLPLSLKAAKDVSKTKVLKGSGRVVQRSKREMGYLRRKAVGKYTFERLVV
ncbi:uncharacterized protein DSM5745_05997 [Aspergillus mulundensis]|uniref:Uncharacterized protein n=1 Tax=Aspergillus mulundensis TaxID=1810919 RepID=A0A3D8RYN0_9EURO|nr:Uncharacterized protein DSM5745_05997 [Aspergillus mulundensis]RDW79145.1 Uncharacterized protein DSM5745_05997 [Aspergillus mulundensis]